MNIIKIKDSEGATIICQDNILTVKMYYKVGTNKRPRIVITTKNGKIIYDFYDKETTESFNKIISDFIIGEQSVVIECSSRSNEIGMYIISIDKNYSLRKQKQ